MVTKFILQTLVSQAPFGKIYTNGMEDMKKDNNMCKTYFKTAK